MSVRRPAGAGSRFLYDSFDAAQARIEKIVTGAGGEARGTVPFDADA